MAILIFILKYFFVIIKILNLPFLDYKMLFLLILCWHMTLFKICYLLLQNICELGKKMRSIHSLSLSLLIGKKEWPSDAGRGITMHKQRRHK